MVTLLPAGMVPAAVLLAPVPTLTTRFGLLPATQLAWLAPTAAAVPRDLYCEEDAGDAADRD